MSKRFPISNLPAHYCVRKQYFNRIVFGMIQIYLNCINFFNLIWRINPNIINYGTGRYFTHYSF